MGVNPRAGRLPPKAAAPPERGFHPRAPDQRNQALDPVLKKGARSVAIYHLSAKVISRAGGRSSIAAAAYRTAGRLRDDRQGLEHDYSRKGGVVHSCLLYTSDAADE